MSIAEIVEEFHTAKATGRDWKKHGGGEHDRTTTVGASEIGGCLRRVGYEKHPEWGVTRDEQFWGYANRGNLVEAFVVSAIRDALEGGEKLVYAGRSQRTFVHPNFPVSATPDGIYTAGKDYRAYIEIKSVDPRTNMHKLPRYAHVMQAQIGMEIVAFLEPRLAPTKGVLVYVDASSLKVAREFDIERDEEVLRKGVQRAAAVFAALAPEQLEAEGVYDGSCKYCPFRTACNPYQSSSDAPETDAVVQAQLEALGDRFVELKKAEDELETVKAKIKMMMSQHKLPVAHGDGWTAKFEETAGQDRLNADKVKALCARTQTAYESLCVKSAPGTKLTVSSV